MVQLSEPSGSNPFAPDPRRQLGHRDHNQMVIFPEDQKRDHTDHGDRRHLLRHCRRLGRRRVVPALQASHLCKISLQQNKGEQALSFIFAFNGSLIVFDSSFSFWLLKMYRV